MSEPLDVRFTARARRQVDEAASWWEENRPLAAGAIHDELSIALELLRHQPGIGSRATNAKLADVRRWHLSRVHYNLYYRVTRGAVQVLAFWHASRGTEPRVTR